MPTRPQYRKTPTYETDRRTTKERGYAAGWAATRLEVLRRQPLCVDCEAKGIVTIACEVHHVQKIKNSPGKRLDWENLMPLCQWCHAERTQRGE